ncbi:MAG: hypothetical protein RLY78_614 [Pseudomonadota bacterium]
MPPTAVRCGRRSADATGLWHSGRFARRRPGSARPYFPTAMALKSTIHKATLQLSDMDRHVYGEHNLTLALHPSETEERLMMRVLAYALNVPADDLNGTLQSARGLSDADEPDLWHKDLSDQIVHWVEVGHPDDRRLAKACAKADRVSIYAYASSTPVWWQGMANKITRLRNLAVWQIPADQAQALAARCTRSMQLQISIQDGLLYVSDAAGTIEIQPQALWQGGA